MVEMVSSASLALGVVMGGRVAMVVYGNVIMKGVGVVLMCVVLLIVWV